MTVKGAKAISIAKDVPLKEVTKKISEQRNWNNYGYYAKEVEAHPKANKIVA